MIWLKNKHSISILTIFVSGLTGLILLVFGIIQVSGMTQALLLLSFVFILYPIGFMFARFCNFYLNTQPKTEVSIKQSENTAILARDVCLSRLGHAIRTPMNAVLGFAQLLRNDQKLDSDQIDYVNSIYTSATNLMAIINDVLELTRLADNRVSLHNHPFSYEDMVNDLTNHLSVNNQNRSLISCDPNSVYPGVIFSDQDKCRKALIQAMEVALYLSSDQSTVFRTGYRVTDKDKNALMVFTEVCIPHISINPDDPELLFEPFNVSAKSGHKFSSGLELVIAREYSKLLNGNLVLTENNSSIMSFRFEFMTHQVKDSNQSESPENQNDNHLGDNTFDPGCSAPEILSNLDSDVTTGGDVSENLKNKLVKAVRSGDMDRISELIELLSTDHPNIAQQLRNHAVNYDYERLLNILESE